MAISYVSVPEGNPFCFVGANGAMFVKFWNLVLGSTGTTWCGRETRLGVGWGEQGSWKQLWKSCLGMARLVECRRIQDGKPYRDGFEWRKHPKLGDFPYLITRGYVRRALERKYSGSCDCWRASWFVLLRVQVLHSGYECRLEWEDFVAETQDF